MAETKEKETKEVKKVEMKKANADKDFDKKLKDLKIELLKQTQKRKNIKKEIARILTMARKQSVPVKGKNNQTKLTGDSK